MDNVLVHDQAEITADGARGSLGGVGCAHEGTALEDGALAGDDHLDDGTGRDVGDQAIIEGLALVAQGEEGDDLHAGLHQIVRPLQEVALHAAFAQSESESISANVRWGKRQSIKGGKVTFQYKTLLGYEKGPDGNPVIIPEEAETVRRIFEWYLAGKSVRDIRLVLVAGGFRNAVGNTDWTTSNLRSILTNEKYCGDALLQKTFVKDCISKKSIPNTGQLAKVLIQNNHEAIISHEIFDAVQLELARRRA